MDKLRGYEAHGLAIRKAGRTGDLTLSSVSCGDQRVPLDTERAAGHVGTHFDGRLQNGSSGGDSGGSSETGVEFGESFSPKHR